MEKKEISTLFRQYYAAECVMRINERYGVEMPIARAVYGILYEGKSPAASLKLLTEKLI